MRKHCYWQDMTTMKMSKKQNRLDANRLSVDFVEEALNYLSIADVEKYYMEDNQKI